jgi:hypothetical protein
MQFDAGFDVFDAVQTSIVDGLAAVDQFDR